MKGAPLRMKLFSRAKRLRTHRENGRSDMAYGMAQQTRIESIDLRRNIKEISVGSAEIPTLGS